MWYRLKEIRFHILSKVHISFMIVLLSIISISISILAISLYQKIYIQNKEYKSMYEEVRYYGIGDNFVGDKEHKFRNDPDRFIKLKYLNSKLKSNPEFIYLETYVQPIYIRDYQGEDTNLARYESGDFESSKKVAITSNNGKTDFYSQVKCFWIGSNVIDYFNIKISEGNVFDQEDYKWYENEKVKIILGADYKSLYKVGDIIQINMIMAQTEAVVVGFLEERSKVYFRNQLLNLDRYVMLPQFEITHMPKSNEGLFAYWFLYLMKNNGTIATKSSPNKIQEIVNEYCKELNIKPNYYIDMATNQQSESFGTNMDSIRTMVGSLAIGISIFTSIVFAIYIYLKLKSNSRYYAILLMNGFSQNDIYCIVFGEIFILLLVSAFISSILGGFLCYLFSSTLNSVWFIIIPTLISSIIPSITVIIRLKNTDTYHILRRE